MTIFGIRWRWQALTAVAAVILAQHLGFTVWGMVCTALALSLASWDGRLDEREGYPKWSSDVRVDEGDR